MRFTKQLVLVVTLGAMLCPFLVGQSADSMIAPLPVAQAPSLPRYLVYRHFLGWISALDAAATAAAQPATADPYEFARPLTDARLSHADLDALRNEARAMTAHLKVKDSEIATAVAGFRKQAKAAAASGQAFPVIPAVLRQLQQERTGLLIQHMVGLRRNLGPATSSALDSYLDYEFVPHLSMKALTQPKTSPVGRINSDSFVSSVQ